jgi:hypothetical protein
MVKEELQQIHNRATFLHRRMNDKKAFKLTSSKDDSWFQFKDDQLFYNGKPYKRHLSSLIEYDFTLISKPWDFNIVEKTILAYTPEHYNWLVRGKDGDLWLYTNEPTKHREVWISGDFDNQDLSLYNHLFRDVKWEDDPCEFRKYL